MGQEPDVIRHDIEATRRDMGRTIDEIEDRVSPKRIARRRTERVRGALTSAKETVMGSPDDTPWNAAGDRGIGERVHAAGEEAAGTLRDLPSSARQRTQGNPLAAGLIAFGAGLLAASLLPRSEEEQQAAARISERLEPVREGVAEAGHAVTEQVGATAREGVEETKETAAGAAREVADEAGSAAGAAKEEARGAGEQVRGDAHG